MTEGAWRGILPRYLLPHFNINLIKSTVVKSEEVVVAEVTSWTTREELEDLGELDWVLASFNEEISGYETDDSAVYWRLGIKAFDSVLNLSEAWELADDASNTLELFTFEG